MSGYASSYSATEAGGGNAPANVAYLVNGTTGNVGELTAEVNIQSLTASTAFTSSFTGTADTSAFNYDFTSTLTEAGSGTHPIMAAMNIRALTLTGGAGATDDAATLRIAGAPTGATRNWAVWIDADNVRADGVIFAELGSATAPAYSFISSGTTDSNTGIFSSGADTVDISTGGTSRFVVNNNQVTFTSAGSAGTPAWGRTGDVNTGMYWPGDDRVIVCAGAADVLEFANTASGRGVLLGTASFGTNTPTNVLIVANGTVPTSSPADTITLYSSDISAGNTEPSFYCEGTAVLATGQADSVSSVRVKMRINGTEVTILCI